MEYRVIRSEDHLAHYGVLGMKWGVRKDRSSFGSGRSFHKVNRRGNKKQSSKTLTKEEKRKRALIIGASVVGAALVGYGAYKLNSKMVKKHNLQKANALRSLAEVNYSDINHRHTKASIDSVLEDLKNNLPQGTTMRKNAQYAKISKAWRDETDRYLAYKKVADTIEKSKRRVKGYNPAGIDLYVNAPFMERPLKFDPKDYVDYYIKPFRRKS